MSMTMSIISDEDLKGIIAYIPKKCKRSTLG